jgi:hypothetical protein
MIHLICAVAEASYPASKTVVMRLLATLSVAIGCMTAHAGDDRFGFATHFEQGWPSSPVMQAIASSGVSYIRDDLNAGSWEPSTGVYVQPSWDMGWLNAAKANGLKVVAILGPNWHYTDKYDPVAMSNLCIMDCQNRFGHCLRDHERTK